MTSGKDKDLRKLLAKVIQLAKDHGTRSEEVRNFIRNHMDTPEFAELAATCILLIEGETT